MRSRLNGSTPVSFSSLQPVAMMWKTFRTWSLRSRCSRRRDRSSAISIAHPLLQLPVTGLWRIHLRLRRRRHTTLRHMHLHHLDIHHGHHAMRRQRRHRHGEILPWLSTTLTCRYHDHDHRRLDGRRRSTTATSGSGVTLLRARRPALRAVRHGHRHTSTDVLQIPHHQRREQRQQQQDRLHPRPFHMARRTHLELHRLLAIRLSQYHLSQHRCFRQ